MLKKPEPKPQQNHLLAGLSADVQNRLFPHLQLVPLPLCAVLYEANRPMSYVYFPTDSIISLQCLSPCGESTAISVVGNEGLLGVNLFMGGETTPSRSMVQSAGYAYRLPKHVVEQEFNRHGQFLTLMLCYSQFLLTQISQTAVCNRHHSIYQRLCRWLLISLDRLDHQNLTMTQEVISNMLGARRESVTESANELRLQGVITYHRGLIHVINRAKLESLSCECYAVVRKEMALLLDYLPQKNPSRDVNVTAIAPPTRRCELVC